MDLENDIVKSVEEGGSKVIDFEVIHGVLCWLQTFLKSEHCLWFTVPSYLFELVEGIHFLLKCDFDPLK